MKEINELLICEVKEEFEKVKRQYEHFCALLNESTDLENVGAEKIKDFGCCICILDKGFIYIGMLTTDGEYWKIENPKNIRTYTSGKGLLWHAKHGAKDMVLDGYDNRPITVPYSEMKHFIETDKDLWMK